MKRKSLLCLVLMALLMAVSVVTVYAREVRVQLDGEFLDVEAVIVDGLHKMKNYT